MAIFPTPGTSNGPFLTEPRAELFEGTSMSSNRCSSSNAKGFLGQVHCIRVPIPPRADRELSYVTPFMPSMSHRPSQNIGKIGLAAS